MRRDNFSRNTRLALAQAFHFRCVRPGCSHLTDTPDEDGRVLINVHGVAAHISAASNGGPRFDSSLTEAQRRHADNGIWLCANCGTFIDRIPNLFSADLLQLWKKAAIQELHQGANGFRNRHSDLRSDFDAVNRFNNDTGSLVYEWSAGERISADGFRRLKNIAINLASESPRNEYLAHHPVLRNRQLQIRDIAKQLLGAVQSNDSKYVAFPQYGYFE